MADTETPAKEPEFFDLIETSSVDPDDIENGKWFTGTDITGQPDQKWRMKLRSFASKASSDADRTLALKYRAFADKDGKVPPDKIIEQVNERLARGVIVDWEKIGMDGKALPCTPENALRLISDPRMMRVRVGVFQVAGNLDVFRAKVLEEIEGN